MLVRKEQILPQQTAKVGRGVTEELTCPRSPLSAVKMAVPDHLKGMTALFETPKKMLQLLYKHKVSISSSYCDVAI